jgi:Protein of unknown function (DUF3662)/Inner membrane component of T3SS, cytoplasmic domain
MSVLRSLESKIAGLVEGTFSRAFRSEVRPVELARKLAKEMEEHQSTSLSRTYVPHEYRIFLSPRDRQRFAGYETALADELAGYLLEHARRERLTLMVRPVIDFETDPLLGLGEFGIQTGEVHPGEPEPARGSAPGSSSEPGGRTMIYSSAGRIAEPLEERARTRDQKALLIHDGRRLVVDPAGVVVGRSRQCDIVLEDPNISRRHLEVRPRGGSWVVADLGSTNGSRINGRSIEGSEVVRPGDEIEIGSTRLTFELE